ncbi:hypothetical protein [Kitasatospora camelliae]|uniref:Uncharacterized protein n=1 Tax=Kitasatospora camelliae TaxID=3156397 RepID=A0AAU8K6W3_9ACTN
MALSTQAASGIAGGMNPVTPSPHSASSQWVASAGASGHGVDGHGVDGGFGSSGMRP